jgi:hypothetical protein
MGREAFSMLLKLIEGKNAKANSISKIVLEPIPHFRESTARINMNNNGVVSPAKESVGIFKT